MTVNTILSFFLSCYFLWRRSIDDDDDDQLSYIRKQYFNFWNVFTGTFLPRLLRERCFVNGIESIICCCNTPHRVKLYWLLPEVRYQKAFPTHESFIIFFCNNCELRFLSFFSSQSTSLNKSTATKNFLNWNLFNWKSFEGEFIAYVVVATQHLEHIPHRDRAHAQWGSR